MLVRFNGRHTVERLLDAGRGSLLTRRRFYIRHKLPDLTLYKAMVQTRPFNVAQSAVVSDGSGPIVEAWLVEGPITGLTNLSIEIIVLRKISIGGGLSERV